MVNIVAVTFAAIALEAVSTAALPTGDNGVLVARTKTSAKKASPPARKPARTSANQGRKSKSKTGQVLKTLQKNPDLARAGASALGSLANIGLQAYQTHEQAKYGGGGVVSQEGTYRRELVARVNTPKSGKKTPAKQSKSRTGQILNAVQKNPDLARAGVSTLDTLANVGLQAYQTHQQAKYGGGPGAISQGTYKRGLSWDDLDELD